MKKRLLILAATVLASVGTWGQSVKVWTTDGETVNVECEGDVSNMEDAHTYQFTSTAHGNLYTRTKNSSTGEYEYSLADIYEGNECNTSYYVQTHYTLSSSVSVKEVSAIVSKDYYIKGSDNTYSSAYNVSYVSGKTVVADVASATKLDFSSESTSDYTTYLTTGNVFTASAASSVQCGTYDESTYVFTPSGNAKAGDVCDNDTYYWCYNAVHKGSELISWGGLTTTGTIFSTTSGIYTLSNGVYIPVTSKSFDAGTDYYTVTFTDNAEVSASAIGTKEVWDLEGKDAVYTWNGTSYDKVNDGDDFVVATYYIYDADNTYYAERSEKELVNAGYAKITSSTPYWESFKNSINSQDFTIMKFVSTGSSKAIISNTVTQKLMDLTKIRVLNLSDVYIKQIKPVFTDEGLQTTNSDGTFVCASSIYGSNSCIETLYTPMVNGTTDEEKTLSYGTFNKMPKLRYLHISDGVETLGKYSVRGGNLNGGYQLSTLSLPNTLKYIKEYAADGHNSAYLTDLDGNSIPAITTLTFPKSLLEIESHAFEGTNTKDVYFLGEEAPIVGRHAWGDDAYISNNAFSDIAETGSGDEKVTVDVANGYAVRDNYKAGSGWECMLHYPATCTPAQAAKYTDPSRNYMRVTYGIETEDVKQDGNYYKYTPGKEETSLTGFSNSTQNAASTWFGNEYSDGSFGGDYTGGYYDLYVGTQYLWPSMTMMYRATVVAQNNLTWDGVTSIGDMIISKLKSGETYTGDGSEFEGLHQFVFAKGDVSGTTDTEKWNLDKFVDAKWHTICLPFNMTKKQMQEAIGYASKDSDGKKTYKIKLCEFTGVIREDNNLQLQFNYDVYKNTTNEDAIVLAAHVPYMIWAKKENAVTSAFENYEIVEGDPIPVRVMSTNSQGGTDNNTAEYRFIGNYLKYQSDGTTRVYIPAYTYYFSSSYQGYKFQQYANKSAWTPYTCVVEAPNGSADNVKFFGGSNSAKFSSIFDEAEIATSITNVTIEADNEVISESSYSNTVYNIGGQKVANNINGLPKGMYIMNGKKFIVK